jgi:hypothetical protein
MGLVSNTTTCQICGESDRRDCGCTARPKRISKAAAALTATLWLATTTSNETPKQKEQQ